MTITELAQLIMQQERVGWSKAIYEAIVRRDAGEARREQENARARERRAARRCTE